MSKSYPILWPSLQKVEQLYRASSSQSQIFCKFKSAATDKFLNLKKPTLRNTDGTIFEITSIGWVLVNGEYLKVNTVDSNGDVGFETSAEPDVLWDGNHLISRKKNKALDIYDLDTNNVKLWKYNGHENQKWLQVNTATTLQPNTDAIEYTAKVSDSTEISVLTYNCLYTEYAHDPPNMSGFETELIGKTSAYGSKKVKKTNLGWHVRKRKIVNNILKHGKPDILLLQETTPHMCADILSFFPGFRAVHSEFGNLGGIVSDGYCYVLFDTSKFELAKEEQTKEMSETIQHGLRFIGLILFHKESQKDIFVASLHLPASGTAPVGSIRTIINELKIPVILGGDFNVTYNPFSNLQNLTGNEPTFYNDDTYKLDWIVGKNVVYKHHTLNEIVEDEGRWPNAEEGSDHTAIFVTLLLK